MRPFLPTRLRQLQVWRQSHFHSMENNQQTVIQTFPCMATTSKSAQQVPGNSNEYKKSG